MQLFVTFGLTAIFVLNKSANLYTKQHPGLYIAATYALRKHTRLWGLLDALFRVPTAARAMRGLPLTPCLLSLSCRCWQCHARLCVRGTCCRVIALVTMIAMFCCGPGPLRQVPLNYALLSLFTLAEAFMVATIASYYTAKSVLLCVGMLVVIVAGLTLFATQVRPLFLLCGICVCL